MALATVSLLAQFIGDYSSSTDALDCWEKEVANFDKKSLNTLLYL